MITIANISMDQEKLMGRGIFTQFLEGIEPFTDVYVENVTNPRLHGYPCAAAIVLSRNLSTECRFLMKGY